MKSEHNLLSVKRAFTKWRNNKAHLAEKIPDYLIDMIKELARTHKRSLITRVLGVSNQQMDKMFGSAIPNFIEVTPPVEGALPVSINSTNCIIQRSDGTQIKI